MDFLSVRYLIIIINATILPLSNPFSSVIKPQTQQVLDYYFVSRSWYTTYSLLKRLSPIFPCAFSVFIFQMVPAYVILFLMTIFSFVFETLFVFLPLMFGLKDPSLVLTNSLAQSFSYTISQSTLYLITVSMFTREEKKQNFSFLFSITRSTSNLVIICSTALVNFLVDNRGYSYEQIYKVMYFVYLVPIATSVVSFFLTKRVGNYLRAHEIQTEKAREEAKRGPLSFKKHMEVIRKTLGQIWSVRKLLLFGYLSEFLFMNAREWNSPFFKKIFHLEKGRYIAIYALERAVGVASPLISYFLFAKKNFLFIRIQNAGVMFLLLGFLACILNPSADAIYAFLFVLELLFRICQVFFRDNFYPMYVRIFSKDCYRSGFNIAGSLIYFFTSILSLPNYLFFGPTASNLTVSFFLNYSYMCTMSIVTFLLLSLYINYDFLVKFNEEDTRDSDNSS